jgi:hypothetical protein
MKEKLKMKKKTQKMPCKIGDTLYDISEFVLDCPFPNPEIRLIRVAEIEPLKIRGIQYVRINRNIIPVHDFGKTVFVNDGTEAEKWAALQLVERGNI